MEKLYEWSKKPYQKYFKKNESWNITMTELINYKEETLGFHLGCFLMKYNFEIQPKLEEHDIIHVLTNTGISVTDEIGMEYFLLGNGKRSSYQFMVIVMGTVVYPTRLKFFLNLYKRGKQSHQFYDLDFLKMLHQPISKIQFAFNIQ
jgi:hypothetical protein